MLLRDIKKVYSSIINRWTSANGEAVVFWGVLFVLDWTSFLNMLSLVLISSLMFFCQNMKSIVSMEGIYIYIYIYTKKMLIGHGYVQMHLKYRSYKFVCVHLNEYEKRIYPQKSVLFTSAVCVKSRSRKKKVLSDLFFCICIS